jgi:hypothetical protein
MLRRRVAVARIEGLYPLGNAQPLPADAADGTSDVGALLAEFSCGALARAGRLGFLQWRSEMGDQSRAHPAERRAEAYLRNALTFDKPEPIVGHTWSIQEGGQAIVLRTMPELYESWDRLIDRFRLVEPKATSTCRSPAGRGRRSCWISETRRSASITSVSMAASPDNDPAGWRALGLADRL